jgi:hypothetical protein
MESVGFVIKQEFENVCDGKQFINLANENRFVAGSRHWWCGVVFWRWFAVGSCFGYDRMHTSFDYK